MVFAFGVLKLWAKLSENKIEAVDITEVIVPLSDDASNLVSQIIEGHDGAKQGSMWSFPRSDELPPTDPYWRLLDLSGSWPPVVSYAASQFMDSKHDWPLLIYKGDIRSINVSGEAEDLDDDGEVDDSVDEDVPEFLVSSFGYSFLST